MTMITADKSKTCMRCNISLRTDEDSPHPMGRCSVQDITEQIRLEQRLGDLARKDPLTGLANRRCFDEVAAKELERAQRAESPLAVVALDIDHFKKVNDTYGHAAGDEVLKELAQSCELMLRSTDLLARMGGEEFVILLPDTAVSEAVEIADRIRENLAKLDIALQNGSSIQFTVSFGVAVYPQHSDNMTQLLELADEALYEAKHSGRNLVKVANVGTSEKTNE